MLSARLLIQSKTPLHIAVADKPPLLGGVIQKIAREELVRRYSIFLDENIYVDSTIRMEDFDFTKEYATPGPVLLDKITRYLAGEKDHWVLCAMGGCGHGEFAARDIVRGEIIGVYSGTIVRKGAEVMPADEVVDLGNNPLVISCRNGRGMASLMQHLPQAPLGHNVEEHVKVANKIGRNEFTLLDAQGEVELLFNKFLKPEILNQVQSANTSNVFVLYQSLPIVIFLANRNIKAGEQFGWNYGPSYWASRDMGPELFDQRGAVISRLNYERTHGWISLGEKIIFKGDLSYLKKRARQCKPVAGIGPDGVQHVISSSGLTLRLFEFNAVHLKLQTQLPILVNVIDNNKQLIKSIPLNTSATQEFFCDLRRVVGEDVIKKLAFQHIYEISVNWLEKLYVNEGSQESLRQVLAALNTSIEELFPTKDAAPKNSSPK
jgi:PII-like signaling protein